MFILRVLFFIFYGYNIKIFIYFVFVIIFYFFYSFLVFGEIYYVWIVGFSVRKLSGYCGEIFIWLVFGCLYNRGEI